MSSIMSLIVAEGGESVQRRADTLLREQVRLYPVRTLALAALAGLIVSKLLRRA